MPTKSMKSFLLAWLFINAICGNAQADILVNQTNVKCPPGYFLSTDGLCYRTNPEPCPFETTTTTIKPTCPEGNYLNTDGKCYPQTNVRCPPGYFLSTDALCYRTNPEPCPFETTTTTTEPTTNI